MAWRVVSASADAVRGLDVHRLPHHPAVARRADGNRAVNRDIRGRRGADVLRDVLGASFAGILGSDRLPSYLTYVVAQRQLCWAHFTRNLLSAQDLARTASVKRFYREALGLQRQLFRLWHRFRGDPRARGGPLTRAQLVAKALPIERAFFRLGARYATAANRDVSNLAWALYTLNQHFFTFVHEDGVDPTNNVSNAPCGPPCSGARSCLGPGATRANAPSNAC